MAGGWVLQWDVSLPASLALRVFPQQILVNAQCRIFIEMDTWSDTARLFSCSSHPLSTTELALLNFKYLLRVVIPVSPPQTHMLGIKTMHSFQHTVERMHASLFQILLQDLHCSAAILRFISLMEMARWDALFWTPSWAGLWTTGLMKRLKWSTSLFID